MAAGDLDALFAPKLGGPGRSWLNQMPSDCRQFVDQIVDEIVARGVEPSSWRQVHRLIQERWPDSAPRTETSVIATIRNLVKERG